VTSTQRGSALARRQLGRRLRALRLEAGKSIEDVVEAQIASRTKMWKIETGRMHVKEGDVLSLARLFRADRAVTEQLVTLSAATRSSSGLLVDGAGVLSAWFGPYADLEAECSTLRAYRTELLHGLLQIEDYARAVTAANADLSAEVVEQRVAFRMARQRTFFARVRPGPVEFMTSAGVLDLVVGSASVMEAQIAHLRAVDSGDGVSVRVLTSTNGVHAAMRGSFTILDFADPEDPPLVYLESLVGSQYVERTEHLVEYRRAFDRIRDQAVPLEEYLE
jgi:transcriptional regulator with XRE-family HTH domain